MAGVAIRNSAKLEQTAPITFSLVILTKVRTQFVRLDVGECRDAAMRCSAKRKQTAPITFSLVILTKVRTQFVRLDDGGRYKYCSSKSLR
jgi:hypothetical protein